MNYYMSDLHLFHEVSIKYFNRPFCTLEEIIDRNEEMKMVR